MKIEILYPSICALNGDEFNVKYLSECIKDSTIIKTNIEDVPAFVNKKIDIIYIGCMSESNQSIVIEVLSKYKSRIENLIDNGVMVLSTGNSLEIFGKYIFRNGECLKGLGIFNYYTKQDFNNRYHELYEGIFEDIKIIGFKSQFGRIYENNEQPFLKTKKGMGNNELDQNEGVIKNSFYGTSLLGPLLIQNPLFVKHLLKKLDIKVNIKYEKEIMDAYNIRLKEYEKLKF